MEQRKRIAVAGATGRVGRHLVELLEASGHDVVAISRSRGVDIATGDGLAEALAGVECVVDVASCASSDQAEATEYFTAAARNLQEVGDRAGVRRIVAVSIIGCDRFTAGYGVAKAVHEQVLHSGPIPVTILRAAQFHEFVEQLLDWSTRDGVGYVQKFRTQLVAARTVAEALADLATSPDWPLASGPSGRTVLEVAGPREERLADAAARLAARRGAPSRIEEISNADDPDHGLYETGGLLPGPHARLAGPTFEEWLESTPEPREVPIAHG